jgi:hypothetical protein
LIVSIVFSPDIGSSPSAIRSSYHDTYLGIWAGARLAKAI